MVRCDAVFPCVFQECQKNADKFRHGLAQNIPRPPADPASVIEDEIQKVRVPTSQIP